MKIKCGISILFNKWVQVIAKWKLDNDLYKLGDTMILRQNIIAILATTNLHNDELWHLRLGHINKKR